MEPSRCAWCGESQAAVLFERPDTLTSLPGLFRLVRCTTCDVVRQDPRPSSQDLERLYPSHYSTYQPTIDDERWPWTRFDRHYGMWKRLRLIERYHGRGHLLDVGSGTGIFLAEAHRRGWHVTGVEPAEAAANYASDHIGSTVIPARFDQVDLPESTFDVVTMWNVLEHMEEPLEDLRHAARLLRPGGLLVISVPNLEAWEARVFGTAWIGWDVPRHLYLFPMRVLQLMLETSGFELLTASCLAGGHATLELTLTSRLHQWRADHPQWFRLIMAIYRSWPARLMLASPLWVADRLRLGTLLTIVARRLPSYLPDQSGEGYS
jgi:SAM-dependent methyltransferase